jgi:hypothetical protein
MDRWYGYKAKSDENWRASNDYQQAHAIALKMSHGDLLGAQHLMRWYEQMAALIVQKNWTKVHRLAHKLLEYERLTGKEVVKTLREPQSALPIQHSHATCNAAT